MTNPTNNGNSIHLPLLEAAQVIHPDYQAVYAALARRVAAAHAYSISGCPDHAHEELSEAMKLIAYVENPLIKIKEVKPE